jgi:hypothetical protein
MSHFYFFLDRAIHPYFIKREKFETTTWRKPNGEQPSRSPKNSTPIYRIHYYSITLRPSFATSKEWLPRASWTLLSPNRLPHGPPSGIALEFLLRPTRMSYCFSPSRWPRRWAVSAIKSRSNRCIDLEALTEPPRSRIFSMSRSKHRQAERRQQHEPELPDKALFRYPNSPPTFTMQKEDSPSYQNVGKYMEY